MVKSILATMKAAQSGDFFERLEELAPLLSGALRETDLELIRVCLEYLMRGSKEIDIAEFRRKLQLLDVPQITEDVMSLADQLINEGRQEGRQEGLQKGEATLLERLLTRRFGNLPPWAREKLDHATPGDLERWSEQILEANTLEEVFGLH